MKATGQNKSSVEDIKKIFLKQDILVKQISSLIASNNELSAKTDYFEKLLEDIKTHVDTQPNSTQTSIKGIHGLAEFLAISPTTAQKLKNSGKIRFAQFERIVLFDPIQIMEDLQKLSRNGSIK